MIVLLVDSSVDLMHINSQFLLIAVSIASLLLKRISSLFYSSSTNVGQLCDYFCNHVVQTHNTIPLIRWCLLYICSSITL